MPDQRHLFVLPSPPRKPRARRTDPVSSHVAADAIEESGALKTQQRQTLMAVYAHRARSSKELAQLTGLDRYMLARRLPELEEQGYVKRQEREGYDVCWWLSERGRVMAQAIEVFKEK